MAGKSQPLPPLPPLPSTQRAPPHGTPPSILPETRPLAAPPPASAAALVKAGTTSNGRRDNTQHKRGYNVKRDRDSNRVRDYYHDRDRDRDRDRSSQPRQSTGRGGGDTLHGNKDWRCAACYLWNPPHSRDCMRCNGFGPPKERDQHSDKRSYRDRQQPYSHYNNNDLNERDHYARHNGTYPPRESGVLSRDTRDGHDRQRGRGRREPLNGVEPRPMLPSRSPSRKKAGLEEGKTPKFPPKFETNGWAYIFHPQSGMFYEAQSNFFYEPKSKLYYGNDSKKYFRYIESENPPFVPVEYTISPQGTPQTDAEYSEPGTATGCSLSDCATAATPSDGKTKKSTEKPKSKKIAIKLSTKSLKSATTKAPIAVATPTPVADRKKKEHSTNIERWSARAKEMAETDVVATSSSVLPVSNESTNISTVAISNTETAKTIPKTASGEPICTICKRKFPTIEKLRRHEVVSALHKENLAKLKAASKRKENDGPVYQDRAKKRREMHGPDADIPPRNQFVKPIISEMIGPGVPHDSLGSSNVGNQMLRKLGWKPGDAVMTDGNININDNDLTQSLRRDWNRIEAIAAGGGTTLTVASLSRSKQSGLGCDE